MRGAVLILACAGLLASCGIGEKLKGDKQRVTFDGHLFKTSLSAVKEDPRMFEVTVKDASRSLTGAEDAGRYEATRYCVVKYGNSSLEWLAVAESQGRAVLTEADTLIMRGRCKV